MSIAPRYFGVLPRAACEVRAVEEYKERDAPFAYYYPPSPDGSRPGIYYANGYDLPSRKYTKLATTTYHEAVPGPPFPDRARDGERPTSITFRRLGARMVGGAYVEGWGLYSERLADEMGLFRDEAERFGMLDAQAWRAARLVVDTGLHALRWPRQRSIDFLRTAGLSETDAVIETDRYICWPGQALTYKIGQREIERLRAELAARDGSRFDLRAFHDAVLGHGSLPLATLSRELPNWVASPGLNGSVAPRFASGPSPTLTSLPRIACLRRGIVVIRTARRQRTRIALTARPSRGSIGRPRLAMRNDRPADRVAEPAQRHRMATEPAARPTPRSAASAQTALYRRARGTMPGGTDSNFRAWGDDTVYVDRGKGGMVWDIDGNEYIDLRMGYGPVILGHGDERVDDYVNERMRKGVSFSLTSEDEVEAMELVKRADRLGRQGADDRVGHRGDDARDARRPGLHRPRQDREVRGPVPRRPRLRADQRLAGRHVRARRRRQAGPPGLGPGHPGRRRRHDHPGPLQPHRRAAPAVRAARRGDRRDHRRAGPRQRPGASCPSPASTRRCAR